MSGTILIIDELATNRIVLKVRLSAAPFRVIQAGSAREALRLVTAEAPDLILANARLGGQSATPFLRALRRTEWPGHVPVILLQGENDAAERLALLRAGADEVLARPVPESLLLARLRNLMRQRNADEELIGQTGAAAGFAEAQAGFARPGQIALFGTDRAGALALRGLIGEATPHRLSCLAIESGPPPAEQDLFVIQLARAQAEEGLRLLADLKATPGTRHAPVMLVLAPDAAQLAVTLLDMGADDVLLAPGGRDEFNLRLTRLLARKRHNEALRAQLRSGLEAALRDPLTGAYNRRHALPWLERQIAGLAHGHRSLAVMVADLDFFKQVNDRHGHAAGDAVLVAVTERLRTHLRASDLLARIGGEEFLIALPDTSRAEAQEVAERLCHAIRATPVVVPGTGGPIAVTLSLGVTVAAPHPGLPPPSLQALLEEADHALYAAKARGRDQARLSTPSAA